MNKSAERNIPNFFEFKGEKINTLEKWENYKEYLKDLFLKEEYGYLPKKLKPEIKVKENDINFAGKAVWETVYFTFENNGKSHTVKTDLVLPRGKENVPVFLHLSIPDGVPNRYMPTEEIIDTGFGVFSVYYEEVTSDNDDFSNGLCGLFEREGNSSFGKISIWAYFASICMDYLLTRKEIDKDNIAIVGHSRLGKTALLCSALDNRFKLTCVNESGCSGAALSRGKTNEHETIKDIIRVFPYWFCEEYKKYIDNENALPFDQHMLISLVAPRYIIVGGAKEDIWADNVGQHMSCALAVPAWELYSKGSANRCVNYYEREGSHFFSRTDWIIYMEGFKEIIKNELKK